MVSLYLPNKEGTGFVYAGSCHTFKPLLISNVPENAGGGR